MQTLKTDPMETILKLKEPQKMSLGTELERQAEEQPQKTALIFEDRRITFEELNREANRYSNFFAGIGLKKGDVVALLMENRPEFLIAASGLAKLGVIVSLVNNGVRGEVLAHALNICDARALIVGHELLDSFLAIRSDLKLKNPAGIFVETEGGKGSVPEDMENINQKLENISGENPSATCTVSSEDVIVYIYTSGTTGFPKACAVTQKRWLILGNIFTLSMPLKPSTIQYMVLPLYHNSGFDIGYSSLLVSGSTMVLRRKFSASSFWGDVRKYKTDFFIYVGELCRYIFNQPKKSDDADNPLQIITGNGMRGDLMEPFRKRFAIKKLIEVYGATEGVGSFINQEEVPGMCGNLVYNGLRQGEVVRWDFDIEEMIRDNNGYAVKCQPGETGLLVCAVNELNRFAGYVNNPEATEEKILHNVFSQGDKYFNSGDLIHIADDDYISFVDRLGDTFRWKSENVSTNQVADVINKFGHIEDANVYGVKVPGMEGRCGMAALKILAGDSLDLNQFSAFIQERLPSFAWPYFIRIRAEIDATNSFKQLKRGLQNQGFNPGEITDPLYFLDPEERKYIPITKEIFDAISNGIIRL